MRKYYSLLFAMAFLLPTAESKTTNATVPSIFPHMGSGGGVNAPAANYSRIIGYSYMKHNGSSLVPVDSTTYHYSYGRGGQLSREDMDDNFVLFDNSYTYRYMPATNSYLNQYHRWQIFNPAGKSEKYTCQKWIVNQSAWQDSARYVYQYNNDLTRLEKTSFDIYYGNIWGNGHVVYQNFYDAANNLIRIKTATYIMSFTYDAGNLMLSRTDSLYYVSSGVWHVKKYEYAYSNSMLTSHITATSSNGVFNNQEKVDYIYTGGNITQTTLSLWQNNSWELQGRHLIIFDGNNNKSSDTWQYFDAASSSYKNASRRSWYYNSYNQPVTYLSETFDPGTGIWESANNDFLYRYYYQPYIPASIEGETNLITLKTYPQPARETLNIEIDATANNNTSVHIFDIHGRMLLQEKISGQKTSVNISTLPAGSYFLKIISGSGQVSKQFIVAR